ncbi:golgi uridine diphosphate-N- acetylglucosamine transporter [Tilletia horrida]|nr:golgi uridine diphosphate-N- acetylglucosamine transporter [Tilletia horrida]
MEQVLTSLQTVESNSARLNSGVDQVFQDFRVRTLEPSDREVAADCQQMEAQITNTAGSDVRTATSSVKALNELAVEMKTDIETIRILSFVFGGCCSNACFLELGTSAVPSAGTLITFAQSLATALTCIPTQLYRPPGSSSLLPRLKAPKVPSSRWSVQIILYLTTSLLKNAAFAYDIPMSVHLVFRSGGLVINMLLGWAVEGRKYNLVQIALVLLVTVGVVSATLCSRIIILITNTHLKWRSLMGLYQERTFRIYDRDKWQEALFYSNVLSLPIFLLRWKSLAKEIVLANQTEPS